MKSILHLIPTLAGGGAERQLAMLVAEQRKRGWDVHVAVRRGEIYEAWLTERGACVHSLGDWRGINPMLVYNILTLAARIKPKIIQTWLPQMDICGGVVAKCLHVPWVMTERSSRCAYDRRSPSTKLRILIGHCADMLVANSSEGAQYWRQHKRPPKAIRVINNAIPFDAIADTPLESGAVAGPSVPTLLMVGSFVESKGHRCFLLAVKELLSKAFDFRAIIVGDGPLERTLQNSVARLGCADRVYMRPYHTHWWGLLKSSSALVSASLFEGQPNVVLEAVAARCPVIVTDIPAHREILDPSSAILVPPDDPGALALAICRHLEDPGQAQQRATNAFDRVKSFTIGVTASAYDRVYMEFF